MRLIKTARDCLDEAIAICGPGVPYSEIGKVIQPLAESKGCSVVKRYTGHGISNVFHSAPTIYHHRTKKVSKALCLEGLALTFQLTLLCLYRHMAQCK